MDHRASTQASCAGLTNRFATSDRGLLRRPVETRLTLLGDQPSPPGRPSTGPLAVRAPRPAARSPLPFLELLLGAADASLSGRLPLGILDPADELVAGERRDVLPCVEGGGIGDQRHAQVAREVVNHPTGNS